MSIEHDPAGWQGWQIFASAVIGPLGIWMFGAYRFLIERKDKLKTDDMTYQQRFSADLMEQRKTLSADQGVLFERLRSEWVRANERNDYLQSQLDRAWDLVRYWYRYCEAILHQMRNQRQVLENLAERVKPPYVLKPWEDQSLPDMENPNRPTPSPPGSRGTGAGTPPPKAGGSL